MSQWAKKGEGGGNGGGQRGGRGGGGNRGGNRGGGKGGGGGNNNTSPPPSSSPPPATAVSASSSSIAAIASSAAAAAAAPAPVSTPASIPPSSSGKDELSSSKSESGESTSSSEAEKTYLIRKGDLAAPLSKAGSLGSKLSIKANFFPITLRIKQLFVFSVIFDPPIPQELGAKRRKELGQFYPILDAAFGRQNSFNGQTINSMKEVDVNALTALIPADENKPYGVFPVGTVSKTGFRVRKNDSTGSQVSSATISYERTVTADDMNSSEISHVTATFVRSLLTRQLKLLLMNNAYFDPKQMHKVGNYQFQLMMGYQSVVNACHNRQALIVDVVHKIYQPESVYKIVAEKMDKLKAGASSNPAVALALFRESRWEESVEEFRGRRMIYRNGRQTRVVRCDFIDFEINLDAPMDPESKDKNNTFRAYFKSKYNVDLKQRFTGMVCEFRMRPSKAWKLIEQGKHVDGTYYPLELCNSTGSLDRDRGDFRMLKAIADISRKPPQEKLNLINKFASLLSTLNSASSSASASASSAAAPSSAGKNGKKSIADMAQENLFIEAKMMEAQARLLPGPRIVSGSNIFFVNGDDPKKNSQVQQGVMKQTLLGTNGKPYSLPSTKPFGVIFSQEEERDEICKYFLEEFGKEVARMKIRLPASKSFPVPAGGPGAWQTKAIEIATKEATNLSFVVVILPQRNTDLIYSMIKTIFIQHGVIHSCIKADSINRTYEGRLKGAIPSYAFQLFVKQGALQWCVESGPSCEKHITLPAAIQNARFGGNVTTMIVAADVSHDAKAKTTWNPPAASSSSSSSSTVSSSFASRQKVDTVGFVATYDANFTQFHSFVGTQTSGRLGSDLIQKSDEYMKGACERFKQKNNKYPEHIIVYRDGVGESQIASFVYEEMKKYQSAFDALKIKPKLTVIVVQKRVGARFFTAHGTAPPGTVIDSGITSSARREFYLVNCETPPNANAVPTRYIIVKDDNEFTMDQIELFTHHLSYNFSNWRGPIKIPAPVKCADRLSRLFGRFIRHANVNPTIASTVYFL